MPGVLCLVLPRFPIERLTRQREGLRRRPFALINDAPKPRILEVSDPAARLGIQRGMTSAEARVLCHELQTQPLDAEQQQQELEELAAWLQDFGARSSCYGDRAVMVLLEGMERYFGSRQALLARFHKSLQRLGYSTQAALASQPIAAYALALHSTQELCLVDPENERQAISQLPLSSLGLSLDDQELLSLLGLRCIGDVLELNRQDLALRFPSLAERLDTFHSFSASFQEALQRDSLWRDVRRPVRYFESWWPEQGLRSLSQLESAIERCARRLYQRLKLRRGPRFPRRLRLAWPAGQHLKGFQTPPESPREMTRRLMDSIHEPQSMFASCRGELEWLSLEITQFQEPPRPAPSLFENPEHSSPWLLDRLLENLGQRLGRDNVLGFQVNDDHRPEHRVSAPRFNSRAVFQKLPSGPGDSYRPLRLYHPPRVLTAAKQLTAVRGQRVRTRLGPERIAGYFWEGGFARDYYAICLENGLWLWVFQSPDGRWYEHGIFD